MGMKRRRTRMSTRKKTSTRTKTTTEVPSPVPPQEPGIPSDSTLAQRKGSKLMGLIQASLKDVSTDFKPVEPGIYILEIVEVKEMEKDGVTNAYRVVSQVISESNGVEDMVGRKVSDFINIITQKGEINEVGLSSLKRYFEACFGKDEVATWEDADYDTDRLAGQQFRGQLKIDSYTKPGETEPRMNNKFTRIDSVNG
jgi:hypothetical protein